MYITVAKNTHILDVVEADLRLAGVFDGLCRKRLIIPVPETETRAPVDEKSARKQLVHDFTANVML